MTDLASLAAAFYMAAKAVSPHCVIPVLPDHPGNQFLTSGPLCDSAEVLKDDDTARILRAIGDVYESEVIAEKKKSARTWTEYENDCKARGGYGDSEGLICPPKDECFSKTHGIVSCPNYRFNLPDKAGDPGQVLVTDGHGNYRWEDQPCIDGTPAADGSVKFTVCQK